MNKVINPKIVDLMEDKGFTDNLLHDGMGGSHYNVTIVDALMWLYEKHGIWIYSYPAQPLVLDNEEYPKIVWVVKCLSMNQVMFEKFIDADNGLAINHHISPTEAYEAAITYCLENLIKE